MSLPCFQREVVRRIRSRDVVAILRCFYVTRDPNAETGVTSCDPFRELLSVVTAVILADEDQEAGLVLCQRRSKPRFEHSIIEFHRRDPTEAAHDERVLREAQLLPRRHGVDGLRCKWQEGNLPDTARHLVTIPLAGKRDRMFGMNDYAGTASQYCSITRELRDRSFATACPILFESGKSVRVIKRFDNAAGVYPDCVIQFRTSPR